MTHKIIKTDNYLLVVDDSEIKEGKTFLTKEGIIHTNIGWNYGDKVIISHLPLNGSPILEGVDLLPPYSRHQEDGLDDAVMRFKESYSKLGVTDFELSAFSVGYLQAREKYKSTEENVIHLLHRTARKYFQESREYKGNMAIAGDPLHGVRRELINMVQSLHQYPTEFECEMEDYCGSPLTTERCPKCIDICDRAYQRPKTITTSKGRQWVGKYK
jgi:hypothetical protein